MSVSDRRASRCFIYLSIHPSIHPSFRLPPRLTSRAQEEEYFVSLCAAVLGKDRRDDCDVGQMRSAAVRVVQDVDVAGVKAVAVLPNDLGPSEERGEMR